MNPAVVVEFVGSEALVLVSDGSSAYRLSPELSAVLWDVQAGKPVDPRSAEVVELESLGVISSTPAGVSRRSVVTGAAAIAGGGSLALSMPSVAMASSGAGTNNDPFALQGVYFVSGDGNDQTFRFSKYEFDVPDGQSLRLEIRESGGAGNNLSADGEFWTATLRSYNFTGTQVGDVLIAGGIDYIGTITFTPQ